MTRCSAIATPHRGENRLWKLFTPRRKLRGDYVKYLGISRLHSNNRDYLYAAYGARTAAEGLKITSSRDLISQDLRASTTTSTKQSRIESSRRRTAIHPIRREAGTIETKPADRPSHDKKEPSNDTEVTTNAFRGVFRTVTCLLSQSVVS